MRELRCPIHGTLFGKATVEGDPSLASFQVACRKCRIDAGLRVRLVLHVFDGDGQCVATLRSDSSG